MDVLSDSSDWSNWPMTVHVFDGPVKNEISVIFLANLLCQHHEDNMEISLPSLLDDLLRLLRRFRQSTRGLSP
jgi:hypothetical protein